MRSRLVETLDSLIAMLESGYDGSNMRAQRRVSPELLNMVALKSQYDKEVAALKASQPKAAKEIAPSVRVYGIGITLHKAYEWNEHHNTQWACDIAKKWFTRGLPPQVIQSLVSDQRWQEIVIWVFNRSYELAKAQELVDSGAITQKEYYRISNDEGSTEKVRELEAIVKLHAAKFGLDKTGRQLPLSSRR